MANLIGHSNFVTVLCVSWNYNQVYGAETVRFELRVLESVISRILAPRHVK